MRKARIMIAGAVLVLVIIGTCLGYNSFLQNIGYLSAGFLFREIV